MRRSSHSPRCNTASLLPLRVAPFGRASDPSSILLLDTIGDDAQPGAALERRRGYKGWRPDKGNSDVEPIHVAAPFISSATAALIGHPLPLPPPAGAPAS